MRVTGLLSRLTRFDTPATGSYPPDMVRRSEPTPPDPVNGSREGGPIAGGPSSVGGEAPAPADLASLPVAGLTRRRMLITAIVLAVGWLAIAAIRQVGDVTAASARANALEASNAQLAAHVQDLDGELQLIQRQAFIVQQARAYQLGGPKEVPFTLQQPAPSLGPDAPGSASVRIGVAGTARTPLESWLTVLFGPG